jgi:DNA polymerase-3 subunit epsilon
MREIVLDTETTGLDPSRGDRIVEIGAVELVNQLPTGATYHQYINPERPMPAEAFAVHGLGDDFLRDKPVFASICDAFLAFIGDAPLVIHNASFDMAFLNAELTRAGAPRLPAARAVDTLEMARGKYPGAGNSLDVLCRRFNVDNAGRDLHGALLDARLLAEVYLELIGGRQPDFGLVETGRSAPHGQPAGPRGPAAPVTLPKRPNPLPPRLSQAEREAHRAMVSAFAAQTLWDVDP